jgi:hypothetical protein
MAYDNSGLRRLQDNLRGLSQTGSVPLTEVLSPAFMRSHTRFASFEAMVEASPFAVQSAEDFAAIPNDERDAFVRSATTFQSWEAMQQAGGAAWAKERLLKGLG